MAATDINGLYNTSMGSDLTIAGIARSGSSGSSTYAVIGSGLADDYWLYPTRSDSAPGNVLGQRLSNDRPSDPEELP